MAEPHADGSMKRVASIEDTVETDIDDDDFQNQDDSTVISRVKSNTTMFLESDADKSPAKVRPLFGVKEIRVLNRATKGCKQHSNMRQCMRAAVCTRLQLRANETLTATKGPEPVTLPVADISAPAPLPMPNELQRAPPTVSTASARDISPNHQNNPSSPSSPSRERVPVIRLSPGGPVLRSPGSESPRQEWPAPKVQETPDRHESNTSPRNAPSSPSSERRPVIRLSPRGPVLRSPGSAQQQEWPAPANPDQGAPKKSPQSTPSSPRNDRAPVLRLSPRGPVLRGPGASSPLQQQPSPANPPPLQLSTPSVQPQHSPETRVSPRNEPHAAQVPTPHSPTPVRPAGSPNSRRPFPAVTGGGPSISNDGGRDRSDSTIDQELRARVLKLSPANSLLLARVLDKLERVASAGLDADQLLETLSRNNSEEDSEDEDS